MTAKEYLREYPDTISNFDEIKRVIYGLYEFRNDKEKTSKHYRLILQSDNRYQEWMNEHEEWSVYNNLGWEEFEYDEPVYKPNFKEELLRVIEEDVSFFYLFQFLTNKQDNIPTQQEIEKAIYEETAKELKYAEMRIFELEVILEDCIKEKSSIRTMKVTTDVLEEILKMIGVTAANAQITKISELVSYLTGFSKHTIRQRLTKPEGYTSHQGEEIDKINKLLKDLKIKISIEYNKYL